MKASDPNYEQYLVLLQIFDGVCEYNISLCCILINPWGKLKHQTHYVTDTNGCLNYIPVRCNGLGELIMFHGEPPQILSDVTDNKYMLIFWRSDVSLIQ